MAADPHCIPCERYDNWIEVDIRDEHNRSFKGLKATLTDETGKSETITLKDGPTLVRGFAVGPVTVKIETPAWLKAAQLDLARPATASLRRASSRCWAKALPLRSCL